MISDSRMSREQVFEMFPAFNHARGGGVPRKNPATYEAYLNQGSMLSTDANKLNAILKKH